MTSNILREGSGKRPGNGRKCTRARGECQSHIGPNTLTAKVFGLLSMSGIGAALPLRTQPEAPMIRSMTGYGRADVSGVRLSLTVECKSFNHRHLDIVVRLPRAFSALELDARRVIQGAVQRGRVEVGVSAAPVEGMPALGLSVDMAQARAYVAMARRVGDDLKLGDRLDLQWVLERPGVLSRDDQEASS